jgi:ribosome biogenesis GTPase
MSKPKRDLAPVPAADLQPGLVVATYGRHCLVETPEGRRLICHPRGKKNQVVVGDQVFWQIAGDEGSIEKLRDRRNLFYRQDEIRTKSFAANLDRVLILIAADPEYSESQLSRALVAAEAERITPIIALNKSDLAQPFAQAWERLSPYRAMGYSVMPVSLNPRSAVADDGVQALCEQLKGLTTLVLGPSGSGKSTLINRLVPDAQVETGEISLALNSGKHTTTSTRWYWVPSLDGPNDGSHDKGSDTRSDTRSENRSDNRAESGTADSDTSGVSSAGVARKTALIDSPGFQEFGLHHIEPTRLADCMPDLRAHVGSCKFYNCTHLHEPGCGVLAQVESATQAGTISVRRHRIYAQLFEELSQQRW